VVEMKPEIEQERAHKRLEKRTLLYTRIERSELNPFGCPICSELAVNVGIGIKEN